MYDSNLDHRLENNCYIRLLISQIRMIALAKVNYGVYFKEYYFIIILNVIFLESLSMITFIFLRDIW